jgi:SecD/SecF fusion protein
VRELGAVPAYATTVAGEPVDVEPDRKRRRSRRGSLIAPEEPGEGISRDEFQELVADLDIEQPPGAAGAGGQKPARKSSGTGVAEQAPPAEPQPPRRDPAADLTPEDLVLKDDPKPAAKRKRPRNKRHGRR